MHGWQSESTHGPKAGCDWLWFLEWLQWSPHPQLQVVAWCSKVQFNCSCSCSCGGSCSCSGGCSCSCSFSCMRFAIFPLHLSKVLRLPRKIDARSYEVLHLSRKIILANLQIGCSKMQPLSGNQRPGLLTSLMNMSFALRLPREMHLGRSSSNATSSEPGVFCTIWLEMCFAPQRRALFRHLNFQKCSEPVVFCTFWLRNVLCAATACTFSTSQLPKVVRDRQFFTLLASKCASRNDGVHFFDISTSKSGPRTSIFSHFWHRNVLRATAACNFSSLIWPDGSAPAALASLLFDPPEPQIIVKTPWVATFFAHLHLLLSDFLFSDLLSSSLLFSDSCHLCFSICPYCRKFDF